MFDRHLILAAAPRGMCNTLWAYSLFSHLAAREGYQVYSCHLERHAAEVEWRQPLLRGRFLGSRRLLALLSRQGPRCERARELLGVPQRRRIDDSRVQVLDPWASLGTLLRLLGPLDYSIAEHVRLRDDGRWFGEAPTLGLHVRRGDYLTWRGGRYGYSLDDYARLLPDLREAAGVARVFVATDDPAARERLGGLPDVFFSPGGSAAQDLLGLSRCDVIVGPPSSFSMFASSYGRTPLAWLFDSSVSPTETLASAREVVSFYRFASGEVLCDDGGETLHLRRGDYPALRTLDGPAEARQRASSPLAQEGTKSPSTPQLLPVLRHVVVTRFNVRDAIYQNNPIYVPELHDAATAEWMAHRWRLFSTCCLPAVQAQWEKRFTWILYFDKDTDPVYKERMAKVCAADRRIVTVEVESGPEGRRHFRAWLAEQQARWLAQQAPNEQTYLITTRLDNDDVLHPAALQAVQAESRDQDHAVVNLCSGLTLSLGNERLLTCHDYPRGPFLSVIERLTAGEAPRTVFERAHMDYLNAGPVIQLTDRLYWIQLIHERNASNSARGRPMWSTSALAAFPHQVSSQLTRPDAVRGALRYTRGRVQRRLRTALKLAWAASGLGAQADTAP